MAADMVDIWDDKGFLLVTFLSIALLVCLYEMACLKFSAF